MTPVALPKAAHDLGQRTVMAPQVQVQAKRDHSSLEVVADLTTGGVGIRLVELDPGFLAALTEGLHLTPWTQEVAA